MPKLILRTPKYCRHRASGQAIVTLNGRDVYLGPYRIAASRRGYDRVIAEWLANCRVRPVDLATDLSVIELIAAYWRHGKTYYVGTGTGEDSNGELSCLRLALPTVGVRPHRQGLNAPAAEGSGAVDFLCSRAPPH